MPKNLESNVYSNLLEGDIGAAGLSQSIRISYGPRLRACLKHVNMPNLRVFCPLDGAVFP